MEGLLLKNARIAQAGRFTPGDVLCEKGKIVRVGKGLTAKGASTVDCGGLRMCPGFIDAHTHGAMGVDVNAATADELLQLGAFYATQGVTAWHASIMTDTEEQTLWCLAQVREDMRRGGAGARLMGAHLEGPFLAGEYRGAMPQALLLAGDIALLRRYQAAAPGVIRYLTVAPEVPGVPELIRQASKELVVAIGHSGADEEAAMAAIRAGARCATHTFNAMRPLDRHEPGILGAVLDSDDVWCEAICDGRHLHPGIVRLLLRCKGDAKVFAVTDSIVATGLQDGQYRLGVNDVTVRGGDARLTGTDVRAGSTLTAIQALRNLVRFTGRPVEDVLPLLTCNVAAALRLSETQGSIEEGKNADLTLLTDELEVAATFVGGKQVYQR